MVNEKVENNLVEKKNFGGSFDNTIFQYNFAGNGVGYSRSGFGSAYTGTSVSGLSFGRKRFQEENGVN